MENMDLFLTPINNHQLATGSHPDQRRRRLRGVPEEGRTDNATSTSTISSIYHDEDVELCEGMLSSVLFVGYENRATLFK